MLKYRHGLYFPELVYKQDTTFSSWENKGKITVYQLDWSRKDNTIIEYYKKRFNTANKLPLKQSNISLYYKLPEPWESIIQDLTFAVTESYYREIVRQSHEAIEEWNREYPFDTAIRDLCLESSIAHVAIAFKLLADCLYDEDTNYFSRGGARIILKHALMYRFWMGQTGGGLYRDHADFQSLSNTLNFFYSQNPDSSSPTIYVNEITQIHKFFDDINAFEKEVDSKWRNVNNE